MINKELQKTTRLFLGWLAAASILTGNLSKPAIGQVSKKYDAKAFAEASLQSLAESGHFSGIVEVWDENGTKFRFQSGKTSFSQRHPQDENTLFKLGSISKQFTAAAILILKDKGKLELDVPANRYLKSYEIDSRITVFHLLTHTSGIARDFPATGGVRSLFFDSDTISELLKREPQFAPGTESLYSNVAYWLLANIVENCSGKSYGKFLETSIFQPLGMDNTRVVAPWKATVGIAQGHYPGIQGPFPAMSTLEVDGAGSIASSMADLKIWAKAVQDESLLTSASWKKLKTHVKGGYSCGIGVYSFFGIPALGHDGRTNGFYSRLDTFAEPRGGVIVLSNIESGVLVKFAESGVLQSVLLDKPIEEVTEPVIPEATRSCSDIELSNFPGEYRVFEGLDITVRNKNNQLWLRGTGGPYLPLIPIKNTGQFFYAHRNAWLRFDDSNPPKAIFWGDRFGKEWECKRIETSDTDQSSSLHPRELLYEQLRRNAVVEDSTIFDIDRLTATDVAMAAAWLHLDGKQELAEQTAKAYSAANPESLLALENYSEFLSANCKPNELMHVLEKIVDSKPQNTQARDPRTKRIVDSAKRRLRSLSQTGSRLDAFTGLYVTSDKEKWSIRKWEFDFGGGPQERLVFCNLENGTFRTLKEIGPKVFVAGKALWPSENEKPEFTIEFDADESKLEMIRATQRTFAELDDSVTTMNLEVENGQISLKGTLHLPKSSTHSVPAVVMVGGSGGQTRDGFGLATVADVLASRGIAAFRFDKRGTGGSTGHFAVTEFNQFAGDAIAAVKRLKKIDSINSDAIGLWGISNGAWVIGQACADDPSIAFGVFVSGGGVSVWEEEIYNMIEEITSQGHSSEVIEQTRNYANKYIGVARGNEAWADFDALVLAHTGESWFDNTVSQWQWTTLTGARKSWDAEIGFDPSVNLSKIKCPILTISGDLDKSHPTDANDKGVRVNAAHINPTVVRLAKTNHDMLIAKTGSQTEYPQLNQFSTEYFNVLSDWILKTTQK